MSAVPPDHIHKDLRGLCSAANEASFKHDLGTLIPRTEGTAKQALSLIQSNQKFINKDDLPYLLGLEAKLVQYCDPSDLNHLDELIRAICKQQGLADESRDAFLYVFAKVSSDKIGQLTSTLAVAMPILLGVRDRFKRGEMMQALEDVHPKTLEALKELFPSNMDADALIRMLKGLKELNPTTVEKAKPWLMGEGNSHQKRALFDGLKHVSLDKLGQAEQMLLGAGDDFERGQMLDELKDIDLNTFKEAMPLLLGAWSNANKIAMFRALKYIHPDMLKAVKPLLESLWWSSDKALILEALRGVKFNTFTQAIPLIGNTREIGDKIAMLQALRGLTPKAFESLSSKMFHNEPIGLWILFAKIMHYLDPKDYEKCIDHLLARNLSINEDPFNCIYYLLKKYPDLAESTHIYLQQRLEDGGIDPEETQILAKDIWNHRQAFLLFEEHSLSQAALNMIIMAESAKDPKNPYRIYGNLKKIREKPPVVFSTQPQEIDHEQLRLDPLTFQKRGEEKKLITFADLKEVDPNAPTLYFDALEKRLNALPETKGEAVHEEISAMTESTFKLLKENFAKPFLTALLKVRGEKNEEVPTVNAFFFAIMHYLSKLSDVVKPKELLSPREEVLLKMSASIQHCSVGQSEGVSIAYGQLPIEYRYGADVAEGDATPEKKAASYIDALVQSQLENILSSKNSMMKEMVEARAGLNQLAHQSRYLKNLIGPSIGLQHRLTFDPYTFTLDSVLIGRDLPHTLEIFYRHFTPEVLVKALRDSVNRTLAEDTKEARSLYNNLYTFVGGSESWELSDDALPILTERGAVNLLIKAGYLK